MKAQTQFGPADRAKILRRFKRLRREIQIDLNTADYWNEHVRKSDEEPIDGDPFGEMRRLIAAINDLLANDPGHGPIAALNFTRSH